MISAPDFILFIAPLLMLAAGGVLYLVFLFTTRKSRTPEAQSAAPVRIFTHQSNNEYTLGAQFVAAARATQSAGRKNEDGESKPASYTGR